MRVKGLNHVELLVAAEDVGHVAETFGALLGAAFSKPKVMEKEGVVASLALQAGLEIIAPASPESPLTASLARKGRGGVGPVAWRVDSVDAMRRHAESVGVPVAYGFDQGDTRLLCLSPEKCFGYLASFIEVKGAPFPPDPGPDAIITRLNRIELLRPAEDVHEASRFFGELLGTDLPVEHMVEHDVLSGTSWEAGVEVVAPASDRHVLNRSLAQKGARGAIGPIVWEVADMERLKARAAEGGHDILYEFRTDERHQVSLSAETLFGYTATFTQVIA